MRSGIDVMIPDNGEDTQGDLIQEVEYDGLFAFMYSDRPSASAVRLPGKISETEKKERLQRLLELQAGISIIKNQALVGSTVQILVDGLSKKQGGGASFLIN